MNGAELGGGVVKVWRSGVVCGGGETESGPVDSCVVFIGDRGAAGVVE